MNLSQASASAAVAAISATAANGTLKLYSGTIPATPETAIGAQVLLATFTFSPAAFAAPSWSAGNESALASFVAPSVAPVANGTVSWARALRSDGTTVIADYTVGTSATDIVIGSTGLLMTVNVSITSFSHLLPAL